MLFIKSTFKSRFCVRVRRAVRDLSRTWKLWTEVYIGAQPAGNGADYGSTEGKMIAKFDAWNAGSAVLVCWNLNNLGTYTTFTPKLQAIIILYFKMGT